VTFKVVNTQTGSTTFEDEPLDGGVATLKRLAPGTYQVSASYPGDANFQGSQGNTIDQAVTKASVTAQLGTSANPAAFGEQVTFTLTVGAKAPGSGTPTGTVTFFIGGSQLGQPVALQNMGGKMQATAATSTLEVGSYDVTATYNGDGNFLGGDANALKQ